MGAILNTLKFVHKMYPDIKKYLIIHLCFYICFTDVQ